jgi:hypothetical protein
MYGLEGAESLFGGVECLMDRHIGNGFIAGLKNGRLQSKKNLLSSMQTWRA